MRVTPLGLKKMATFRELGHRIGARLVLGPSP